MREGCVNFCPRISSSRKKSKKSLNFANGYAIIPEEAAWRARERVSAGRAETNLVYVLYFPKRKYLSFLSAISAKNIAENVAINTFQSIVFSYLFFQIIPPGIGYFFTRFSELLRNVLSNPINILLEGTEHQEVFCDTIMIIAKRF